MNIQEYDILNAIFTTTNATQRSLADCSGHSLGIVNRSIKKLTSDGYLTSSMQPTDKAIALYKHSVPQNAIILAAGFGMRMVPINCRASIGVVGNGDHNLINVGKAGRKRHMGVRPTVRGSVMNPNDHPHGGGEGRAPIGRPGPCTPWGKPALGLKTRKKNKSSNKMIVRRRDGKALK